MDREHEIIKASIIGIVGNLILVAFKMLVGVISGSIAIILDGVNNATDSLSSIVTIVGTKLAGRKPDRNHPFGYGRIEYLTSVVIALIILVAGLISLRESIDKIIHPGTPEYSVLTITVIVVAIIAKIGLGIVFARYGKKTESGALIASGIDSNYDALLSAGTLVVALFQNVWNINIDGAVGILISLVVCKAGIDVLRDSLAPIIGSAEDRDTVNAIRAYVSTFPNVCDVQDIIFDNFGRTLTIGSAHITVPDDMTAQQVGQLTREISKGIQEKFGMIFTIGIYAENTTGEYAGMRAKLTELCAADPAVIGAHAFYVVTGDGDNATMSGDGDDDIKTCYFDLVVEIESDGEAAADRIVKQMSETYPDFLFDVQVDFDYTE